jgi:rhodanese-related sulfurtransferase
VASIGLEPVAEAIRPGRKVLDVRRPGEWDSFHVDAAINIPLSRLVEQAAGLDRNAAYATVCAGGYRSVIAASVLERMGFANVTAASDGMDAYRKADLPA